MIKKIRLETKNLIVRTHQKKDAKNLYDTLNDKNVLKYIPEESISMEQAQDAIDWLISNYDLNFDYKYSFAIEAKESNDYIGWCGLGYLDYDKSQKEIYITLKSRYWGKGFATESLEVLIDYIFNELELKELVAVVKSENIGSQKVIEKLGFKYEGVIENIPEEFSFYEGELYYTLKK